MCVRVGSVCVCVCVCVMLPEAESDPPAGLEAADLVLVSFPAAPFSETRWKCSCM